MKIENFIALCFAVFFAACSAAVHTSSERTNERLKEVQRQSADGVDVTFLQMNDVYEISPVENGKFGGMARVATIRKELLKENPHTFTVVSGDFISPSAIGTSMYQGQRINGMQMVDAMNAVGVDFVTFGNHEFDLGYEPLERCINASQFTWISSNIHHTQSVEGVVKPFEKTANATTEAFPMSHIITARNSSGAELRIGMIGLTLGSNSPSYTAWSDPFESARQVVNELKPKTDIIVALTHLSIEDDKKLASLVPEIDLILGGHEHTNMLFKIGETLISKADANARSVYVHRLRWSPSAKSLNIVSELKTVNRAIPDEPATAKIVNEWTTRAYAGFQEKGFNPEEVVTTLKEPLDGRESTIRFRQTNLGSLISKSMLVVSKKSRVAIFNSGSIRLDDELSGTITQYDIIRTLPFGGKMIDVEMKGTLLQRVLDAGRANVGAGGYLQYEGVGFDSSKTAWNIAGKAIDPYAKYWVIVSDYLFSGNEHGIEFFSKQNVDVLSVNEPFDANDVRRDIRLAVIGYLKK